MKAMRTAPAYTRHRFPPAIIAHAVWLSFRFSLSYRDVEELLAERGVVLTDETVRQWCRKFGQRYANALRRRRPQPGDTWPLDAVFSSINGRAHSRWRAVDQDGQVLDIRHCQVKPFGRRRRSESGERSAHRRPDPACTSASDGQNWLGVGRFRSAKT
jgi:transposase-like protein